MSPSLSLLVFGDICPTADTRPLFDNGSPEALFGSLSARIASADLALANLECVLSDTANPADKIGPVLRGREADAAILGEAGFDILGLANNHIADCGSAGVLDTIAACSAAGIETTGAGANNTIASKPIIFEKKGWRIGIVAAAEHEFNAAGPENAGAHIFDPLEDLERLRELKLKCDYVVVLYHGGIEYYTYPSPLLQRIGRALVRNGADLVLCQHSHVIATLEKYEGGHILYGQGNAVYGHRSGQDTWNEGLAVSVTLTRPGDVRAQVDLLPIGCDTTGAIDLLAAEAAGQCLSALGERSAQAEDPVWVGTAWEQFCERLGRNELPHVLGFGLWLTRANRVLAGGLVRMLFSRRQRMVSMNVVRCDAHRDVVLTAFRQSIDRTK